MVEYLTPSFYFYLLGPVGGSRTRGILARFPRGEETTLRPRA